MFVYVRRYGMEWVECVYWKLNWVGYGFSCCCCCCYSFVTHFRFKMLLRVGVCVCVDLPISKLTIGMWHVVSKSTSTRTHTHTCAYICRFCFFYASIAPMCREHARHSFPFFWFRFRCVTTRSVMGYRGRMETVVLLRHYKTCKTVSQVKCHATMPHNWGQATHTHTQTRKKLFVSTKLCCGNEIGALIACVSVCTFALCGEFLLLLFVVYFCHRHTELLRRKMFNMYEQHHGHRPHS